MSAAPAPPPSPARPPKLPFPLQEGEQVVEICRRHWLYIWPRIALMTVAAISPMVLLGWVLSKLGALHDTGLKAFAVVVAAYVAYWLFWMLLDWYRFKNDIWVITNQRIIDSTKRSPFNLRISTTDLVNVQDMSIERDGIFRTVFDYGDVVCQTAAEVGEFRLPGMHHPRQVQALIDKERDRERLRTHSTFTG